MRSLTPTLDKTTRCMDCDGLPKPCTICAKRLREFRALKAVARAAEHLVNEDRNRAPGTIHCSWLEAVERTRRALVRLSREQSKKGGARP